MKFGIIVLLALFIASPLLFFPASGEEKAATCDAFTHDENDKGKGEGMAFEIRRSDKEWKERLTPEQFRIAREKGTERAFTGKYYAFKGDGVYKCVCCGNELFSSEEKYDSGSGWPSYWAPIDEDKIVTETDTTMGMARTEIMCAKCGAHLGHVFEDGPKPTGLRYCVNSASLDFVGEEKK